MHHEELPQEVREDQGEEQLTIIQVEEVPVEVETLEVIHHQKVTQVQELHQVQIVEKLQELEAVQQEPELWEAHIIMRPKVEQDNLIQFQVLTYGTQLEDVIQHHHIHLPLFLIQQEDNQV